MGEYKRTDPVAREGRVAWHVEGILTHLDPKPNRSGLDDTPRRVARMYLDELCAGYEVDVPALFKVFQEKGARDMVVVKDIPMVSLCEHHLVPFTGRAHIGYLPDGHVVGLSKFKRVVDAYARRLQVQERLTSQITDAINENIPEIRGCIVVIECEHLCMTIRGVQAPGTKTVTSAVRGAFNENQEGEKEEFFRLLGINGR